MANSEIHFDFYRERLATHFVYESYDQESGLFFNRGSQGFVLLGWPLVGTTVQAQGEIAEFLQSSENLPAGSSLQVLMLGSHHIDDFLNNWYVQRKGEIFIHLAERRVKFLQQKAREEGNIKDIILLISITIPDLNADIDEMIQRREALRDSLKAIGLVTENVNSALLLKFIRLIFGWPIAEHPELNYFMPLNEQILPEDFSLFETEDCINLDNKQVFISLEASKRPAAWRLAAMDLFLGNEMRRGEHIKSNFLLHFGLQILPNQTIARTSAMAKREALIRNINAGMSKFFPDINEEAADLEGVVASLQTGDRMAHIHFNVVMWDTHEKVKQSASQFCSMLRRSGWYFLPCKYDHLAVLLASLPMQLVEEIPPSLSIKLLPPNYRKVFSKKIGA